MRPSMITSLGPDDSKKDRKSPKNDLSDVNLELSRSYNETSVFVTDL